MSGQGLRVDIDGLSLRYGTAAVLEDIDLHIGPGERLCLVGPNGAGKSSLLRCLTGVAEPSEGSVRLDQVPLAEIERSAIARTISVVPSQVDLPFSMRVEDVVLLARTTREPLHWPVMRTGQRPRRPSGAWASRNCAVATCGSSRWASASWCW